MGRGIAKCLIGRRPEFVRAWLDTIGGSEAERKIVRPMEADFGACFGGGPWVAMGWAATYNYQAMREGLLEALMAGKTIPETPPPGLARVEWYSGGPTAVTHDKAALPGLIANSLGFCIAKSDWAATRAFVTAGSGSPAERDALGKITPLLSSCVLPGQKLALDKARLRAIMIETVYHAMEAGA